MRKIRRFLSRWQRGRGMAERVLWEDALKHIQNFETHDRRPSLESLAGALEISTGEAAGILNRLVDKELVQMEAGEFQLSPLGHDYAMQIIRAHRLWEQYLAEETGFSEREWHTRADQYEHQLSREQANELYSTLGHPTHDPHGDPIPTVKGELRLHGGKPLTAMRENISLRIVHIEDEPDDVYIRLVNEGLHPGMVVQITEISSQRVHIRADSKDLYLPTIAAANISVVPLPESQKVIFDQGQPLSDLEINQKGRVLNVSPAVRGPERRRLMDLGLIPGTIITAELNSPMGDPTAYRVRGALIALRKEQADLINVLPLKENDS